MMGPNPLSPSSLASLLRSLWRDRSPKALYNGQGPFRGLDACGTATSPERQPAEAAQKPRKQPPPSDGRQPPPGRRKDTGGDGGGSSSGGPSSGGGGAGGGNGNGGAQGGWYNGRDNNYLWNCSAPPPPAPLQHWPLAAQDTQPLPADAASPGVAPSTDATLPLFPGILMIYQPAAAAGTWATAAAALARSCMLQATLAPASLLHATAAHVGVQATLLLVALLRSAQASGKIALRRVGRWQLRHSSRQ